MRKFILTLAAFASLVFQSLAGDALPFGVTVGGQAAKDGTPFASIEKPVAPNAELAVDAKGDMTIVNVHPVNEKNEQVPGSQPAIILMQGTQKTTLDKTMDGKKLAPGRYILSVVGDGKTASIIMTVQ